MSPKVWTYWMEKPYELAIQFAAAGGIVFVGVQQNIHPTSMASKNGLWVATLGLVLLLILVHGAIKRRSHKVVVSDDRIEITRWFRVTAVMRKDVAEVRYFDSGEPILVTKAGDNIRVPFMGLKPFHIHCVLLHWFTSGSNMGGRIC